MVFCSCTFIYIVVGIVEERADWFEGGGEGKHTTTITGVAVGAGATAGVGWWHVASTSRVDRVRGECYNGWIGLVVYPRQGLFMG